jgi:hypothetical protein
MSMARGTQKQLTDLGVVGWVLGGKKSTRSFFNCGFELPSPRNAQKRDKKNREKIDFGFFVDCFVKTFRHDFL